MQDEECWCFVESSRRRRAYRVERWPRTSARLHGHRNGDYWKHRRIHTPPCDLQMEHRRSDTGRSHAFRRPERCLDLPDRARSQRKSGGADHPGWRRAAPECLLADLDRWRGNWGGVAICRGDFGGDIDIHARWRIDKRETGFSASHQTPYEHGYTTASAIALGSMRKLTGSPE